MATERLSSRLTLLPRVLAWLTTRQEPVRAITGRRWHTRCYVKWRKRRSGRGSLFVKGEVQEGRSRSADLSQADTLYVGEAVSSWGCLSRG